MLESDCSLGSVVPWEDCVEFELIDVFAVRDVCVLLLWVQVFHFF